MADVASGANFLVTKQQIVIALGTFWNINFESCPEGNVKLDLFHLDLLSDARRLFK